MDENEAAQKQKEFHEEMEMTCLVRAHTPLLRSVASFCVLSLHLRTPAVVSRPPPPTARRSELFLWAPARDQQLIIVFCTYVMQMSLYSNWHSN